MPNVCHLPDPPWFSLRTTFKGTVSRDFLLLVFFMNHFPPSPRVFHFENSRRYSRVKMHHRYQRHRWQIFLQFSLALLLPAANLPPVSTIPAANLPPVPTMPVANCHRYQWHRRQICHRCCWHRWQIMATISCSRYHKVNLKAKIYIYVSSTTQRCSNKIIKILLLEGFFHLPPVSTLSYEYLREFSKKFETALMVYSEAWGKLVPEKNQKQKISWHCPFN